MKIQRGNSVIDLDNNETVRKMVTLFRLHPYKFMNYEDFNEINITYSTWKWYMSMIATYFDNIYRISKGHGYTRYIYIPDQVTSKEYTDLFSALTEIHSHACDILSIVRENIASYSDN